MLLAVPLFSVFFGQPYKIAFNAPDKVLLMLPLLYAKVAFLFVTYLDVILAADAASEREIA